MYASQGCKVAFDMNLMFGGADGGRFVEREAQMATASVSMQFASWEKRDGGFTDVRRWEVAHACSGRRAESTR